MDLESDSRKRLVRIVTGEESSVRAAGEELPVGCPIREVYASCQYLRAMSSKGCRRTAELDECTIQCLRLERSVLHETSINDTDDELTSSCINSSEASR